ncbi:DODA-type extradiol aromatic ring-opening family dioxygenase [Methylobacillus flagellatus]|uniref:Extradiol ring-cleavage dioxygenase, class III enzyme, subunit B n=1 Tax=Methylobacillus flagellatus (strain ATCC 51484 / DSM 6875 / VKM B-1610 / KT) TaxID=265072 RepID=Q1GXZ0_METFK|nr:class III extradiol ring-cleavage dioxygenase [Methylobacillus flagellatus]ABE50897.1 Extradiol ring-cleavage dioxygenase, class III enzyme, subunit B [Methylobacillus flagellatus KT]
MNTLFISHGAPSLALEPGKTGAMLAALGQTLPRPDAILVVSAHWDTSQPRISAATQPDTIHDFSGFPRAMYEMQYPAPGAPALADIVAESLAAQGMAVEVDPVRGLDHGAWVPLMLMYPEADIPVTQLSIQSHAGPRAHYRLGQALAGLQAHRVMLLCSGAITHNLHDFFSADRDAQVLDYVPAFSGWMAEKIAAGDVEALLDYRRQAPGGIRAHPYEDHLMPLFVALGATQGKAVRHTPEHTFGILAMDAYVWHQGA